MIDKRSILTVVATGAASLLMVSRLRFALLQRRRFKGVATKGLLR